MESPSLILGKLFICDSNGRRWCEPYFLATTEVIQAKNDFLALCRYRAACLASEYTVVSGHIEFVDGHRPSILVIEKPLPSPWSGKIRPLLSTLNIAVECRFHSVQGRHATRHIHGVGRTGPRTGFLKSVEEVYESNAVPLHDALSSAEEGFRAFVSFLRDHTIHARTKKSGKVLDSAPWKSVTIKDIDLEAEVELLIDEKENTDMLPTLVSLNRCKTLKVVQVGPLRLFFELPSNHKNVASRIVGFVVDGQAPCVCDRAGQRLRTDKYLSFIEPDRNKWLPEHEFARKWLETSKMLMSTAVVSA